MSSHQDGEGRREMTSFPRQVADYDVWVSEGLPAGFPDDWVESDSTVGNSVLARLSTPAGRLFEEARTASSPSTRRTQSDERGSSTFSSGLLSPRLLLPLGFREIRRELPAGQLRTRRLRHRPCRSAGSSGGRLRHRQHVHTGRGHRPGHEHGVGDPNEEAHGAGRHRRHPRIHARRDQSSGRRADERPSPGGSAEPRLWRRLRRLLRLHDCWKGRRQLMGRRIAGGLRGFAYDELPGRLRRSGHGSVRRGTCNRRDLVRGHPPR